MIEIKNLDFSYKHTPVFHNINLTFKPGSIYGLLGENGVGKTTLLKIISGLQQPQMGTCEVDGYTSFDREPKFLENIVFMPDEVVLPDNATPAQYVKELAPFYPKYAYGTFLHLMQEMGVEPERRFAEMSFGQQKKSLIACALSLGTDYVLLDEPTNGLDIPSKTDFRMLLSKRATEDTTIIISTHQVKDVENLLDPLIILTNDDVLLNADIATITTKLSFDYDSAANPEALFTEQLPGGFMNVCVNHDGRESQVNIEGLFNAVLRNRETIKRLFQ
ncbi:MAG: ATP-binding cassette domain-containing protein [Bacteroidales bacterium]|nr:ATP-binding cassette domain-containing protein [Bacteroidales bacterium]